MLTQHVHKNMTLKHCGAVVPLTRSHVTQGSVENDMNFVSESQRPLTVILAWLAAKEKYLEKYRALWLQRGFDVLTVKMTPYQFLIPSLGAKKLISDLLKFLFSSSKHYPDIILHCFSVGAYEFGEMLTQLKDSQISKQLTSGHYAFEDPKKLIDERIKGIILDSAVNLDGASAGVSRSMTDHRILAKALEGLIDCHLKVSHSFATKHYLEASDNAHSNYLKAPSLMFTSDADKIGSPWMSLKLKDCWEKLGLEVDFKRFSKSGHVQHFAVYPDEYVKNMDRFLSKVKFSS